jgi:hypothetical protein
MEEMPVVVTRMRIVPRNLSLKPHQQVTKTITLLCKLQNYSKDCNAWINSASSALRYSQDDESQIVNIALVFDTNLGIVAKVVSATTCV